MAGARRELRFVPVAELTAQLRRGDGPDAPFDESVVLELVRRAECGERLQLEVQSEALRSISPSEGYVAGDF